MTSDEAHKIACRALGSDSRIKSLLQTHGNAIYSSLIPPNKENDWNWVELVQLGIGEAAYVDDSRGSSVLLARCIVDPDSGHCRVLIERKVDPDSGD